MDWIVFLTGMFGTLTGCALGFCYGWYLGKIAGEADGVAWATKRLHDSWN